MTHHGKNWIMTCALLMTALVLAPTVSASPLSGDTYDAAGLLTGSVTTHNCQSTTAAVEARVTWDATYTGGSFQVDAKLVYSATTCAGTFTDVCAGSSTGSTLSVDLNCLNGYARIANLHYNEPGPCNAFADGCGVGTITFDLDLDQRTPSTLLSGPSLRASGVFNGIAHNEGDLDRFVQFA